MVHGHEQARANLEFHVSYYHGKHVELHRGKVECTLQIASFKDDPTKDVRGLSHRGPSAVAKDGDLLRRGHQVGNEDVHGRCGGCCCWCSVR